MVRTALTVADYTVEDGGAALSWQNIDFTNGNVINDPTKIAIIARTAENSTHVLRLVSTQKGVTHNKNYTIAANATFGQLLLVDLDIAFFGKHGGTDEGKLYIDWPDCDANTDVAIAVVKRAQ